MFNATIRGNMPVKDFLKIGHRFDKVMTKQQCITILSMMVTCNCTTDTKLLSV